MNATQPHRNHLFITGTDTGVGKTFFTSWLVRHWRRSGRQAVGLKPIASGDREDALSLWNAGDRVLGLDEINPIFLAAPAAPLLAARKENRILDFTSLNALLFQKLDQFSDVAIEGVGGWRVPLSPHYEVRDWARDLALPVVVVAQSKLGVINHTLLTVDSVQAAGLRCAGVVLNNNSNDPSPEAAQAFNDHAEVLTAALLSIPCFRFDETQRATGDHIPGWLGGEET